MDEHIPVMLSPAIEALAIKGDGIYVDLTLGRAGHSAEILRRLDKGWLYAFDLDETAIEEGGKRLSGISTRFTLIHGSFADMKEQLASRGVTQVDGILADLGVSSPQFDDPSRGFSYRYDARLDMRMDVASPLSAYEVVNFYPRERLLQVLRDYGEERDAARIVNQIEKARQSHPIETTFELVDLIKKAKPMKELAKKGHPAKQTFQALRIEVNGEAKALEAILRDGPGLLRQDGRMAIITFMSLDDRATKKAFQALSVVEGSRHDIALRPEEVPTPDYALYSRHPIAPSEEEKRSNPRSVSALLRVLIRTTPTQGEKP